MADTVESTPCELNVEAENLKEKSCDVAHLDGEKEVCAGTEHEAEETTGVETTDGAETTGTKRKSDDAEIEDEEEAKKVKTSDTEEDSTDGINGTEAEKTTGVTEESNGKSHDIPEEEKVKKVVDEEDTPTTEEAAASS